MGRILGNHPSIYTFNELHFFEKLWSPEDDDRKLSSVQAVFLAARLACIQNDYFFTQGDPRRFLDKARTIVQNLKDRAVSPVEVYEAFLKFEASLHGKVIPCEQTPGYVFYIKEILNLFPRAKIINMVRDPRDILLSQKHRWKRRYPGKKSRLLGLAIRTWMNYHPVSTSCLWNAAMKTAYNFNDHRRIHPARFEDVLERPENEVRKICEFIGITYDRSMLKVPMIGSSLVPDRDATIGIDRERASNWERGGVDSAELFICQLITGDTMKRANYRRVAVFPNPLKLIFYLITFPIKFSMAFLIHMKDIKNIKEAIKKRLQW